VLSDRWSDDDVQIHPGDYIAAKVGRFCCVLVNLKADMEKFVYKLRLPICEIFQLFGSFVYFILLSFRKVSYIGER